MYFANRKINLKFVKQMASTRQLIFRVLRKFLNSSQNNSVSFEINNAVASIDFVSTVDTKSLVKAKIKFENF